MLTQDSVIAIIKGTNKIVESVRHNELTKIAIF